MAKADLRIVFMDFRGDEFFIEGTIATIPGTLQTLFTSTVAASKVLNLHQVLITCRMRTDWRIYVDDIIIGSGKTGAGHLESSFPWFRPKKVTAGKVIKLKLLAPTGTKAAQVDYFLHASQLNA